MPMTRRLLAALPLAAGAIGCSDPVSPTPDADAVIGVYALHTAAGAAPPALVQQIVEVETGLQMQAYVTSDTLELDSTGRYQQRARIEVRSGSVLINRARWADHGTYALRNGTLHFESDYFQNVTFDGTAASGSVRVTQDIVGEGTAVEYVFRPLR